MFWIVFYVHVAFQEAILDNQKFYKTACEEGSVINEEFIGRRLDEALSTVRASFTNFNLTWFIQILSIPSASITSIDFWLNLVDLKDKQFWRRCIHDEYTRQGLHSYLVER